MAARKCFHRIAQSEPFSFSYSFYLDPRITFSFISLSHSISFSLTLSHSLTHSLSFAWSFVAKFGFYSLNAVYMRGVYAVPVCRFNPWNTNCMLDTNILLNSSRFYQRDLFFLRFFFIIFAPHISLIRFHLVLFFRLSSLSFWTTLYRWRPFSRLHILFYNICSLFFDKIFSLVFFLFGIFFFSSVSVRSLDIRHNFAHGVHSSDHRFIYTGGQKAKNTPIESSHFSGTEFTK